jgi:hypothetical protein
LSFSYKFNLLVDLKPNLYYILKQKMDRLNL